MDALWTDTAPIPLPAVPKGSAKPPAARQAAAIRSLEEWELLLAGGGEGGWEWP